MSTVTSIRAVQYEIFPISYVMGIHVTIRAGQYDDKDDNYLYCSSYVIMLITVNHHGDIIGNVSNYIFASL